MNDAKKGNVENERNENGKNELISPVKKQLKNRPQALGYRDTNSEEANSERDEVFNKDKQVQMPVYNLKNEERNEENKEISSSTRWLPTRSATFTVYCDENEEVNATSSKGPQVDRLTFNTESKENEKKEGRSGQTTLHAAILPLLKEVKRSPLQLLQSYPEETSSDMSRSSNSNPEAAADEDEEEDSRNESDDDSDPSLVEKRVRHGYSSRETSTASSQFRAIKTYGKEIAAAQVRCEEASAFEDYTSSLYTVPEHRDRTRIDPVYTKDVYNYMRQLEVKLCPSSGYLDFQEQIGPSERFVLVDWIAEISYEFTLSTDALHIAVSILDRVLSVMQCPRRNLQLVGVTAIMLAAKFEEIYTPGPRHYVRFTSDTYTLDEVLRMERIMFSRINYQVLAPTTWWFASRLTRMSRASKKIYCMVRYLSELSLLDHTLLDFKPSVLGAASFFLTSLIFRFDHQLLNTETDFAINDLRIPARKLLALYHEVPNFENKGMYRRYGTQKYEGISRMTIPNNFNELDNDE